MKPGKALHRDFGIEIEAIDLSSDAVERAYPKIRELFEIHSLVLFRNQNLDDSAHIRLASLFGPLENRGDFDQFQVSRVSNQDLGCRPKGVDDAKMNRLNLQSNMLWHTDSTFMPVPALANILHAKVLPSEGGQTEFVSTRAGWRRMDPALRIKIQNKVFLHRYSHSREKVNTQLAQKQIFTKWADTRWRSLWRNPVTGEDGVYIASHAFGVSDLLAKEGAHLIETVLDALTQPDAIYSHKWQIGDVLIWDERATLHRGRPWPYEEARTLTSICVSATGADGLYEMRG